MNILKIITRSKNLYNNQNIIRLSQQKQAFYRFNDLLKTELHYQKHFIKEWNYYKRNNDNIECHIDVIIYDENDDKKIENNELIKSLVKNTILEEDVFVEIDYLKSNKPKTYELNNIFLL